MFSQTDRTATDAHHSPSGWTPERAVAGLLARPAGNGADTTTRVHLLVAQSPAATRYRLYGKLRDGDVPPALGSSGALSSPGVRRAEAAATRAAREVRAILCVLYIRQPDLM